MSMKEVANELNLKPGTVAFHKYRMMETLGLKTNAELLEYAIKRQMPLAESDSLLAKNRERLVAARLPGRLNSGGLRPWLRKRHYC
jgi:hypothetical protein